MKFFIFFMTIITITGCSYIPQKIRFDNIEYYQITKIQTDTQEQLKKCPNINLYIIHSDIKMLQNYEAQLNPKMLIISDDLMKMSKIQKGSKVFCELKLKALINSTKKIQKTLSINR